MSFGENLTTFRKWKNMTQETLAESMNVSRQTVSKWEQNISMPDMDKLLELCDIFHCSLDQLVRGDVTQNIHSDTCGYDKHMNSFSKAISVGVWLILFGVSLMVFLTAFSVNETLSTMIFLILVAVSATVFIVSGIQHSEFTSNHPHIDPFYTEEEIGKFNSKFPYLIAVPVALILIGVIIVVGSEAIPCPKGFDKESFESLFAAALLFLVSIAASVLTFAGMQKSKYNIEEYNKNVSPDEKTKKENSIAGKCCGCIMLIATIVFLLTGFIWNLWNICWVAFPVGGVLCGIVSIIFEKN